MVSLMSSLKQQEFNEVKVTKPMLVRIPTSQKFSSFCLNTPRYGFVCVGAGQAIVTPRLKCNTGNYTTQGSCFHIWYHSWSIPEGNIRADFGIAIIKRFYSGHDFTLLLIFRVKHCQKQSINMKKQARNIFIGCLSNDFNFDLLCNSYRK